ncbi:MAG TPA: helix-turn-helix transcriptional regulator [Pseudonocardiaceae bacterium]|jgi:transcriptional regulator with XRE-family HTH domain
MRLDDEATVGERIAYYRKRRGMTQEVLCGLVGGRSTEWLRQIENGKRDVDKLSTIVAVANALKVSPLTLLPGPFRSNPRRGTSLGSAPDVVPDSEAAMLRYDGMAGFIGVPDRPMARSDDLRRRMRHAFLCSQTERWSEMAPFVPDMIADAAWYTTRTPIPSAEKPTTCRRSCTGSPPGCWTGSASLICRGWRQNVRRSPPNRPAIHC